MHELTRRIRSEEGIALPVAMLTMMVVGTLSAILLATAIASNQSSVQDANRKSATQIASAGAQAAIYRLSAEAAGSVPGTDCFTTTGVLPIGGVCAGQTDSYGSGSYTYWVSPSLAQGDPCTGYFVQNSGQPVSQRCVTATGTVNGVTSRIEQRIVSFASWAQAPVSFPLSGMLGLGSVNFSGNGDVVGGDLGSNGSISLTGADTVAGHVYYTNPANPPSTSSCVSNTCTQTSTYTLPPPDDASYASTATANSNALISWPSGIAYDAATRSAIGVTSGTVVIPSGTYNFCNLGILGKIQIPAGATVVIYMDSQYRAGSGCGSWTGNIGLSPEVDNLTGDPSKLVIEAYGDPAGAAKGSPMAAVALDDTGASGSKSLYAEVYAPNSAVVLNRGLNMTGQLIGYSISGSTQTSFTPGGAAQVGGSASAGSGSTWYPSAWHQCPTSFTGDPRNGCQ